jgi:hypothetical protein
VRVVVFHRFGNVKELVSGASLRCVYFVIGPLISAIKLGAMQDVPWTKAYGMMYLTSFLLAEGMAWFTCIDRGHRYPKIKKAKQDRLGKQTEEFSEFLDYLLALSGSLLHLEVLFWAVLEAVPRSPGKGAELGGSARLLKHVQAIAILVARALLLSLNLALVIDNFTTFFWIHWVPNVDLLEPVCFIFDRSILVEDFTLPIFISRIISTVAGRHKSWAGQVLLLNPRYGDIDRAACSALVVFLIGLCVCLLWYAFRYDFRLVL